MARNEFGGFANWVNKKKEDLWSKARLGYEYWMRGNRGAVDEAKRQMAEGRTPIVPPIAYARGQQRPYVYGNYSPIRLAADAGIQPGQPIAPTPIPPAPSPSPDPYIQQRADLMAWASAMGGRPEGANTSRWVYNPREETSRPNYGIYYKNGMMVPPTRTSGVSILPPQRGQYMRPDFANGGYAPTNTPFTSAGDPKANLSKYQQDLANMRKMALETPTTRNIAIARKERQEDRAAQNAAMVRAAGQPVQPTPEQEAAAKRMADRQKAADELGFTLARFAAESKIRANNDANQLVGTSYASNPAELTKRVEQQIAPIVMTIVGMKDDEKGVNRAKAASVIAPFLAGKTVGWLEALQAGDSAAQSELANLLRGMKV